MNVVSDVKTEAHCLLIPPSTYTIVNYANLLNFVDVEVTTGLRIR